MGLTIKEIAYVLLCILLVWDIISSYKHINMLGKQNNLIMQNNKYLADIVKQTVQEKGSNNVGEESKDG